jgi:hypothetical protein
MIRAAFKNEEAIDQGGVAKELFTLGVQKFIEETQIFSRCGRHMWFQPDIYFQSETFPWLSSTESIQFLLGLIIGVASYNKILVELALPSVVYKIMMNAPVCCMLTKKYLLRDSFFRF